MMIDIFQYSFVLRAFSAGIIIAIISPLIGFFLVLKRYSLIADTLAHVSLAGVALGFVFHIHPLISALGTSVLASFAIEKLRGTKRIFGESALAIFLSGSLALAVVIISAYRGMNTSLYSYLFGSIITVTDKDISIIIMIGSTVLLGIIAFYKELLFVTFDEDSAKAMGIPTQFIHMILITLAALTVSASMPIVGVLLISALMVIPVVSALQFKRNSMQTIILAQFFSITSVCAGIIASFYANISAGGSIVLLALLWFILSLLINAKK